MISERELRAEMKRYPAFIKRALRHKNYAEALKLQTEFEIMNWIVEDK